MKKESKKIVHPLPPTTQRIRQMAKMLREFSRDHETMARGGRPEFWELADEEGKDARKAARELMAWAKWRENYL